MSKDDVTQAAEAIISLIDSKYGRSTVYVIVSTTLGFLTWSGYTFFNKIEIKIQEGIERHGRLIQKGFDTQLQLYNAAATESLAQHKKLIEDNKKTITVHEKQYSHKGISTDIEVLSKLQKQITIKMEETNKQLQELNTQLKNVATWLAIKNEENPDNVIEKSRKILGK